MASSTTPQNPKAAAPQPQEPVSPQTAPPSQRSPALHILTAATGSAWQPVYHEASGAGAEPGDEVNRNTFRQQVSDTLLSKHLLVLTGLGTSLCVKDPTGNRLAPTMGDLWNGAKRASGKSFDTVVAKVKYDIPASGENIEYLLSRCQLLQKLEGDATVAAFIEQVEELIYGGCRFVKDDVDLTVHETFLRKIARRSTRLPRLRLFTTNYDKCFEAAAQRSRFTVIDGFSHTLPQEFDGGYFSYDLVRRDDEREAPDYISNVFHLYKVHGSVDWERQGHRIIKTQAPKRPLMVYPRESKFEVSYDQPFLEMMSRLQMALRQPDTGLVVLGFGFNDHHISQPVLSAIRSNVGLKALFVAPDLRNSKNHVIKEVEHLIRQGDARLTLAAATFESFVPLVPELVALTEQERHVQRLRRTETPT